MDMHYMPTTDSTNSTNTMTIIGQDDGSDSLFYYTFYNSGLVSFATAINEYNHTDFGMVHRKRFMTAYDFDYKTTLLGASTKTGYLMIDYG